MRGADLETYAFGVLRIGNVLKQIARLSYRYVYGAELMIVHGSRRMLGGLL
ncbi:MAG TPA: hypothetical protein VJW94_04255 [Candidatus Acidoferrum sp.]|nr:hypothetical protein [Candidatus Acidoferrum sp.]